MEFWVILVAFRNGKTAKNEKNIVHSKILQGFWIARALKTLQKQVFWTDVIAKNV